MTPSIPAHRERYLADNVATASPAKLLVMLYDRLALDLSRAEQALAAGDRTEASSQLQHAQDIVIELLSSLDISTWEGAPGLAQLYSFLITQLVNANVKADASLVGSCRALVEPLRDAWREAAASLAVPAAAA